MRLRAGHRLLHVLPPVSHVIVPFCASGAQQPEEAAAAAREGGRQLREAGGPPGRRAWPQTASQVPICTNNGAGLYPPRTPWHSVATSCTALRLQIFGIHRTHQQAAQCVDAAISTMSTHACCARRLPRAALAAAAETVAARLALLPLLRELHVERLKLEIAQNEQARS